MLSLERRKRMDSGNVVANSGEKSSCVMPSSSSLHNTCAITRARASLLVGGADVEK